MKKITLSKDGKNRGKFFALVDDVDFERLNQWRWAVNIQKGLTYALRRGEGKKCTEKFYL